MPNARVIAVDLLHQIHAGDCTLDHLLQQAEPKIRTLQRADRALLHALVFGTLRWQGRLDWTISSLTSRPKKRIDPLVRNILRLGLFQMQFLDRIPVSAAVNTSVELAKTCRRKWAAGFINGVLRRAAVQHDKVIFPDRTIDPAAYLSVYHAFPIWMVTRWIERWGVEETEALCIAINTVPKITVRTNTLCTTRQNLLKQVLTEAQEVTPTPHCPEGISLISPHRPIPQWSSFHDGWFQVQNEAAQCVAHLLCPEPGQTVWDACAGLGTKTAHLAQIMGNQGRIVATDLNMSKLERLRIEMRRLGVGIVDTVVMDLLNDKTKVGDGQYDRILLDAPCSGLGVLQKNPDGKWRSTPMTIRKNHHRQANLLENAARHLKPGGVIVYAVCSFETEENEDVVHGFLQKHPEFGIHHSGLEKVANHDRLITPEGFLRTFPHRHHMDGFFAAALSKRR